MSRLNAHVVNSSAISWIARPSVLTIAISESSIRIGCGITEPGGSQPLRKIVRRRCPVALPIVIHPLL
jgi:hypothetical protein